jgi:hypothetical protein
MVDVLLVNHFHVLIFCFPTLVKSIINKTTNFREVVRAHFSSKLGMPYTFRSTFSVAFQWYMARLIWKKTALYRIDQNLGVCKAH